MRRGSSSSFISDAISETTNQSFFKQNNTRMLKGIGMGARNDEIVERMVRFLEINFQ